MEYGWRSLLIDANAAMTKLTALQAIGLVLFGTVVTLLSALAARNRAYISELARQTTRHSLRASGGGQTELYARMYRLFFVVLALGGLLFVALGLLSLILALGRVQ